MDFAFNSGPFDHGGEQRPAPSSRTVFLPRENHRGNNWRGIVDTRGGFNH